MKRWETLLALLAVILASLSALQIPGRLLLALTAMLMLSIVGSMRLRAAIYGKKKASSDFDAVARAEAIRKDRARRFTR
ncbi:MAG TPA: hypothetical protein VMV73_04970 [Candidatus Dormibacteraeota bacterium]|nr:hypothetical protein [Candidatus Dormibacteraeota bacterium]